MKLARTRQRAIRAAEGQPAGTLTLEWTADLIDNGEPCFEPLSCRINVGERTEGGVQLGQVTIGTMGLWRLRPDLDIAEWMIEMTWQSLDFVNIENVLLDEEARAEPRFSMTMDPECIIIAHVVSIDPYWRGAGIGPAVLREIAHEYQACYIFLEPHAFAVRLNDSGEPDCDFDAPRSEYADRRVRKAWRRAGYTPVGRGVWMNYCDLDGLCAAQDVTNQFDRTMNKPAARAWLAQRRALALQLQVSD